MTKKKSKSKKSRRAKASSVGRNIVVVTESDSGRFQQKVNALMSEGYEIVWSTYRHPKEEGYFCVIMGGDFSKNIKRGKKETPENPTNVEQDDDSNYDDNENDN